MSIQFATIVDATGYNNVSRLLTITQVANRQNVFNKPIITLVEHEDQEIRNRMRNLGKVKRPEPLDWDIDVGWSLGSPFFMGYSIELVNAPVIPAQVLLNEESSWRPRQPFNKDKFLQTLEFQYKEL